MAVCEEDYQRQKKTDEEIISLEETFFKGFAKSDFTKSEKKSTIYAVISAEFYSMPF